LNHFTVPLVRMLPNSSLFVLMCFGSPVVPY
jgi:hypothetical protein